MTVIVPTIGRVVWYWKSTQVEDRAMVCNDHEQPMDAHIVFVHSEKMVNITIFDHEGTLFKRTSVELIQEGEPKPYDGRFCSWMPYQVGQAKKHASDAPA